MPQGGGAAIDLISSCLTVSTSQSRLSPYFRIYDLRSTYATRLSAGGVAASG